jgi:DNA-binding NarL/FixJ family response regulator
LKKKTVVIIDDHRLIREMWATMLEDSGKYEVSGISGFLEEAIEIIKITKPEIILLDLNLKEESGFDAVPLIKKFSPSSKIIAVSMHSHPAFVKRIIHMGAKGFVTKNSSHEEFFKTLDKVSKGEIYICDEIKSLFANHVIGNASNNPELNELTWREIEIVKFLINGHTSKEIASRLHITVRTIEVHRHNILKKMKLNNTASLINYINKTNLLF